MPKARFSMLKVEQCLDNQSGRATTILAIFSAMPSACIILKKQFILWRSKSDKKRQALN
jgi:hypothetical protein